jgi:hypothetical protein
MAALVVQQQSSHHDSSPNLSGSVPSCLSGLGAWGVGVAQAGAMSGSQLPPMAPAGLASQGSLRRRSKHEIADQLLENLRQRGMDVDSGSFAEDLRAHFESLPSRWVRQTMEHATDSAGTLGTYPRCRLAFCRAAMLAGTL